MIAALEEEENVEVSGGSVYSWHDGVPSRRAAITGFDKSGEPTEVEPIKP